MILDLDPFTGTSVTMDYNAADDSITIGHHQDCTPIIDNNKRQVIEANHTQQIKNDWIKYATIPYAVIMQWKNELGVNFMNPAHFPMVMNLINSRDFRDVKTTSIHHDR
jgi:hypothetical protein